MSASMTSPESEAQRWQAWQKRGVAGDRRRVVAVRWVMAIVAVILGGLFARVLSEIRCKLHAWSVYEPISPPVVPTRTVLEDLHELVDALDCRVPHLDRVGERDIARDAAALKALALTRIHEIERRLSVKVSDSVVQDDAQQ